jgi:hypothetical protein
VALALAIFGVAVAYSDFSGRPILPIAMGFGCIAAVW